MNYRKILCGGSCYSSVNFLRRTKRIRDSPIIWSHSYGFRVVQDPKWFVLRGSS